MKKPDYREFTLMAMLQDQTEIVRFIIQNENRIDPDGCFLNRYDISVSLTTGRKVLPSQHYYDQINRLGSEYRSLQAKMQEIVDDNEDTTEVEAEIESVYSLLLEYEEAVYKERTVYEWRLIPYWIAESFIQKGETVFRHMGNNWWGVKDIMLTGIFNHKILTEIYEGIL